MNYLLRRRLRAELKEKKTTITRKADLIEKWNSLHHRIKAWWDIQHVYMPGVQQYHTSLASTAQNDNDMTPYHPECESLHLLSSLPANVCQSICLHDLPEMEQRLQLGQAEDALNEVRQQLRVASSIIEFKNGMHYTSQHLTRKTRDLMNKFHARTHHYAE